MDLSVGGLFIETAKLKRVGATTNLHFLSKRDKFELGCSAACEPGGGLGLKFKAASEKDRPNLTALVRRLRSLS